MESGSLTPMQKELLKMFNLNHSDEYVIEIKKAICEYYQKKIDKEFDRLFEEGKLTMEMIESWTNEDLHREMRENRNAKARS